MLIGLTPKKYTFEKRALDHFPLYQMGVGLTYPPPLPVSAPEWECDKTLDPALKVIHSAIVSLT